MHFRKQIFRKGSPENKKKKKGEEEQKSTLEIENYEITWKFLNNQKVYECNKNYTLNFTSAKFSYNNLSKK